MSERQDFIRAICDQPADDAPRLVFADWLEEHGEPERAEFIRVQIALADVHRLVREQGQQAGPSAAYINGLADRQLDLFIRQAGKGDGSGFWHGWFLFRLPRTSIRCDGTTLTILHGSRRGHRFKAEFYRGFVGTIHAYAEDFVSYANTLFRNDPIVYVNLVDRDPGNQGPGTRPDDLVVQYPFVWRDMGGGWSDQPSLIPYGIFRQLAPVVSGLRCYKTERDARTELSAACVRYGRPSAGRISRNP